MSEEKKNLEQVSENYLPQASAMVQANTVDASYKAQLEAQMLAFATINKQFEYNRKHLQKLFRRLARLRRKQDRLLRKYQKGEAEIARLNQDYQMIQQNLDQSMQSYQNYQEYFQSWQSEWKDFYRKLQD